MRSSVIYGIPHILNTIEKKCNSNLVSTSISSSINTNNTDHIKYVIIFIHLFVVNICFSVSLFLSLRLCLCLCPHHGILMLNDSSVWPSGAGSSFLISLPLLTFVMLCAAMRIFHSFHILWLTSWETEGVWLTTFSDIDIVRLQLWQWNHNRMISSERCVVCALNVGV